MPARRSTAATGTHARIADSGADEEEGRPGSDLASAMDDLVTAIIRIGVAEAAASPSVQDALERIIEAAPTPTPPGLLRFVGRMRASIHHADQLLVARMKKQFMDAIRRTGLKEEIGAEHFFSRVEQALDYAWDSLGEEYDRTTCPLRMQPEA